MPHLRIEGLAKSFRGEPVLSGVHLKVDAGQFVAILGASGSGKTTLLRLLSGFERADDGVIEIDGVIVSGLGAHVPPERRNIGYVTQDGALFPHLSVAANIVFGLSRPLRRTRGKAEELLERVGLPASYASRAPHQLSGGEQQRVALARALAPEPKLVLLDEPFSGLDAALRIETRHAVKAALAAAGATALLVTHDQPEALSMAQQIAVLRNGRLAQTATPEVLYRRPIDADLACFVGEAVLLPGIVDGDYVTCALGRLPLAVHGSDGRAEVMLRPEQVTLTSPDAPGVVQGKVVRVTYYGHDASVVLSVDKAAEPIFARVSGHRTPRPGEIVGVTIEGKATIYRRQKNSEISTGGI